MADFAQFRTVGGSTQSEPTDAPITLETGTPSTNREFFFDLPDLDVTREAVLMFKVSGHDGSRLVMSNIPNGTTENQVINFVLDSTFTRPRSWHEIVQGNQFAPPPAVNKFVVEIATTPGAKVTFSDLVLLYHAHTP